MDQIVIEGPDEDRYVTDTYTLAHAACFRGNPEGTQWIMLVKTVDGKVDFEPREEGDEPVIRFYFGISVDNSPEEQHRIVREGVEIQGDALDTFFGKKNY